MEQYLIDTNAVSDYLANAFPLKGMQFMDTVIDAVPNLSIITQISHNTNDFKNIKGLKFIDPHTL